jgi:hypothetical protein
VTSSGRTAIDGPNRGDTGMLFHVAIRHDAAECPGFNPELMPRAIDSLQNRHALAESSASRCTASTTPCRITSNTWCVRPRAQRRWPSTSPKRSRTAELTPRRMPSWRPTSFLPSPATERSLSRPRRVAPSFARVDRPVRMASAAEWRTSLSYGQAGDGLSRGSARVRSVQLRRPRRVGPACAGCGWRRCGRCDRSRRRGSRRC